MLLFASGKSFQFVQVFVWSHTIKHGVWYNHHFTCDHMLSKIAKRRSDELDGSAEH